MNKQFLQEKNDSCPPWSKKADRITHDRINQMFIGNNAVLNIYDACVLFPKFFHPDPQSIEDLTSSPRLIIQMFLIIAK